MHFLSLYFLFGILSIFEYQHVTGLRCFYCKNADSNSKCRRSVPCWGGASSCENVVRVENGILRISKGCQQLQACRDSSKQNRFQCSPVVRTLLSAANFKPDQSAPPSVCRSCCTSNNCNSRMFLKEARIGAFGARSWRSVLPSIRNVKAHLVTPTTAFITFVDTKGHSANFFNVLLNPRVKSANPVVLNDKTKLPGLNVRLPRSTITFLVTGLSAGVQYSIRVVSKQRSRFYSQRIYTRFVTKPRPPSALRVLSSQTTSIRFSIDAPRAAARGDRVNYYAASYKKASDKQGRFIRIPNSPYPGPRLIKNLLPSTGYIIKAWTNVVDARGRRIASSVPINITAFTGVPGVSSVRVASVRATSIQWTFRVSTFAGRVYLERFAVRVQDLAKKTLTREEIISGSQRSYTASDLTPGHVYAFSIKALSRGRESNVATSKVARTPIRCYSCEGARDPEECSDFVECPIGSNGCWNVVRRRSLLSRSRDPNWYRVDMRCKQPRSVCDATENSRNIELCSGANSNPSAPETCSCCCDGDLCNGLSNDCGHVFQWLGRLRAPEKPVVNTPFCPVLEIENGETSCTNEVEIGSVCTVKCIGNRYVVGEDSLRCFDNGQWNAKVPKCQDLEKCSKIPTSTGTNVKCTNEFNARSTCQITCDPGFVNPGENVLRCLHTGRWTLDFIPQCLLVDKCQPHPCFNGATCHPVPGDFECECIPGFTGKTCSEKVVCVKLTAPGNGQLQCTKDNRYSSTCRFSCNYGYEQQGSNETSCLADGYWMAFEPTRCIRITCEEPPLSLVNEGQAQCTGSAYGDSCNFTCPPGLTLAGGPSYISCQKDKKWSDSFPCCDLQCPPHAKVDLYFLLDSSSSLGVVNWNALINFTVALLDQFALGPNDLQVGVGRYNSRFDAENEIQFGNYADYKDLKRKLYNLPYNGRGTRTGSALKYVISKSLKSPNNRKDAPDILILITDGRSSDRVRLPARALRRRKDTKVYAIGVSADANGKIEQSQLNLIATSPKYVYVITEGYKQLAVSLSSILTEDVCWTPCQYQENGLSKTTLRERQLAAMAGNKSVTTIKNNLVSSTTTKTTTTTPSTTRLTRPPIPIEPIGGEERPFIEEEVFNPES